MTGNTAENDEVAEKQRRGLSGLLKIGALEPAGQGGYDWLLKLVNDPQLYRTPRDRAALDTALDYAEKPWDQRPLLQQLHSAAASPESGRSAAAIMRSLDRLQEKIDADARLAAVVKATQRPIEVDEGKELIREFHRLRQLPGNSKKGAGHAVKHLQNWQLPDYQRGLPRKRDEVQRLLSDAGLSKKGVGRPRSR